MSNVRYNAGTMTIEVDGLDDVSAVLGDLRKKTPAVAKVAINATARQARKLMIAEAKARGQAAPERLGAAQEGQQQQPERGAAHRKLPQRPGLFPDQAEPPLHGA